MSRKEIIEKVKVLLGMQEVAEVVEEVVIEATEEVVEETKLEEEEVVEEEVVEEEVVEEEITVESRVETLEAKVADMAIALEEIIAYMISIEEGTTEMNSQLASHQEEIEKLSEKPITTSVKFKNQEVEKESAVDRIIRLRKEFKK